MFPVDSTEGQPLYLLHFVNRADGSHSFIVNLNVLIKSTIISGYFFTPSQCEKLEEQNCEAFVAVVNSDGELITAGTDMAKNFMQREDLFLQRFGLAVSGKGIFTYFTMFNICLCTLPKKPLNHLLWLHLS